MVEPRPRPAITPEEREQSTDIERGTGPERKEGDAGPRRVGPEDEERRINPGEKRPGGTMP